SNGNHGTGTTAYLLEIDPRTARAQQIAIVRNTSGQSGNIHDVATVGSRFIGSQRASAQIVEIDVVTGIRTDKGSGVSYGNGMASHEDGTIYFMPEGVTGLIYKVNPTTGARTSTAVRLTDAPSPSSGVNSATFYEGELYIN